MASLLFEIGTEELPSWYVPQAKASLAELMAERLNQVGLDFSEIHTYATPRRIAASVKEVADKSEVRTELRRGPAAEVAFDDEGNPSRAAQGFAKSNGIDPSELIAQETDKGRYVFARRRLGGEDAKTLLPPLLVGIIEDFPAPRKMHWGSVETPFLRPITWLVALLDEAVLDLSVAGLRAGRVSRGHRFLASGEVELPHADAYLDTLRDAFVIADVTARQQRTLKVAQEVAAQNDLTLIFDHDLLEEVSNLVEYPTPILGSFAEHYLELPEEVLSTTMTHHQSFFPTRRENGALAPTFVGVSNNRVPDETLVRQGYEQVLDGRLGDARFFWDADREKSLSQHAWGLSGIGVHRQLGTVADKVTRVGVSTEVLAERLEISEHEREVLSKAVPVFRADLATQMVAELPELEGVMARAYAMADGYNLEVATALEEGARPLTAGGALPESTVGALLAAADRFDKLIGFFDVERRPSGSADPFGLRRDAIAAARILNAQGWFLAPNSFTEATAQSYGSGRKISSEVQAEVIDFLWDRVAGLLGEEGIRTQFIRAAAADNPPVITAARRCHLLRTLSYEEEFETLLTLYKRAANLARELDESTDIDTSRFESAYESALYDALIPARDAVTDLITTVEEVLTPWDLGRGPERDLPDLDEQVVQVIALKTPLDEFLDNVYVNVENQKLRRNRLVLLSEVRDALLPLGRLEALEGMAS